MAGESIRELIIQNVQAALAAGSPPAQVVRCPLSALPESVTKAIVIIGPGVDQANDNDAESTDTQLTLEIGCMLREVPDDGHTVDQDLDPLTVWVHQKMMANGGVQNNLATDTRYVSTEWALEKSVDFDLVGAKMTFRISYSPSYDDPTQLA